VKNLLVNGFYTDKGQFREDSLKFIDVGYRHLGFTKVVDRYDFKRGDFWVFERVVSKWFFNGFYFEGDGFRGFVIDEELIEHPFKIGDVVKIGFRFKDEKCFDMKIVFLRERGDDDE